MADQTLGIDIEGIIVEGTITPVNADEPEQQTLEQRLAYHALTFRLSGIGVYRPIRFD